MRVVAILSEKGGAGKSTLAVHLATASHLAGQGVALLDLDPQGSAYAWAQRRNAPPEAQAITPIALSGWLDKLRGAGADLVVIDTPRDANNISYTAACAADAILIPLQPGGFDLLALTRTLDLCRLARKRPFVVLNALRPGSTRAQADMAEAVAGYDCEIAPAVLHYRADFRAASALAKTAQEFDPASKAAEEIEALYLWLSRQLALATTSQNHKRAIA